MNSTSPICSSAPARPHRKRGSLLAITMIFGTILAVALGSFITLTTGNLKLGGRSFQFNGALNLCEAGVEYALFAMNNSDWSSIPWSNESGDKKVLEMQGINLGQGMTGKFKVVVFNASTSSTPRIVAEATVTPPMGAPLTKQIEVKVARRSHWANGLVARETVVFSGGNAAVDSFDSEDPNHSTNGLYDADKRKDNGSVGSASVALQDNIDISNASIWGYVAVAKDKSQFDYRNNATVLGEDSPGEDDPDYSKIDWNRVATDFTANFDPVAVPSSFDQLETDVDVKNNQTADLGASGTSTTIRANNITVGGVLNVWGDVTLVVTNIMEIKGSMVIQDDSSLTLYIHDDLTVGGTGVANKSGLAENFLILGTAPNTGTQVIKLHGNGVVHAAVYAPNASVEMKGGGSSGEMSGSVVAYDVKITGNYAFHYDEALAKLGGSNPFAISRWRELVKAGEREKL